MKCNLCNSENIEIIHLGTRDNPDINVYRCNNCKLKFLSKNIVEKVVNFYEEGGMHNYSGQIFNIDKCILENNQDNIRRAQFIKDYIKGKRILDFGCGWGGGIKEFSYLADHVSGVEISNDEYNYLKIQGYDVCRQISDFGNQHFDVITSFHVLEHLPNPKEVLGELKKYLTHQGLLILETPNAEDALLELYKCEAFADFTYWSPHIYLYNQDNLNNLAEQSGYQVISMHQIQRYPLANHMYWLSKGKPGGHIKWEYLCDEKLDTAYYEKLKNLQACDTLMTIWKPINR